MRLYLWSSQCIYWLAISTVSVSSNIQQNRRHLRFLRSATQSLKKNSFRSHRAFVNASNRRVWTLLIPLYLNIQWVDWMYFKNSLPISATDTDIPGNTLKARGIIAYRPTGTTCRLLTPPANFRNFPTGIFEWKICVCAYSFAWLLSSGPGQ